MMERKARNRQLIAVGAVLFVILIGAAAAAFQFLYEPPIDTGSPEYRLASRIERKSPLVDVLMVKIDPGESVNIYVLDIEAGRRWSEAENNTMSEAFWMAMEFAAERELTLIMDFWNIQKATTKDQQEVEIYVLASTMICSKRSLAEIDFTEGYSKETLSDSCNGFGQAALVVGIDEKLWLNR